MPKRMLIDASHPEETRVVVLDGQKVEEFDFEAASKRPLKGNIYLAKVTRVEPSLQAAFVEYGGNRQGFLAFSEIHPDYYQIPVADRMALLAEQEADARRRQDDEFESFDTGNRARAADPPPIWRKIPRHESEESSTKRKAKTKRQKPRPKAKRHRRVRVCRMPPKSSRGARAHHSGSVDPRRHDGRGNRGRTIRGRSARPRRTRAVVEEVQPHEAGAARAGFLPAPGAALDAPPSLQDPGSHQAPPGDPGAGGEGRARQQRRGAHDLSLAGRPLLRADAQHAARRRHLAQDHQCQRPQALEVRGAGARAARRHGPHHPHGGREPHQGRDQARLRISPAHVGHDPRHHAEIERAGLRLRGRRSHQARHPRSLQQGRCRRSSSKAKTATATPRTSCAC